MGPEFEERKAVLIKTGQWLDNTKSMRFTFGNTYELIQVDRFYGYY